MSNASTENKNNPRQIASMLLLVILIGVLAFVVVTRWDAIVKNFQSKEPAEAGRRDVPEPKGDPAVEKEAFDKLTKRGLLVIAEKIADGPEKRVTSISFCDIKTSLPAIIDDEMLSETAKLYRLNSINASECKITDEQLHYFSGLTNLSSLILSGTPITDAGLVHLRNLASLDALYLTNTAVTDRGLDHIAALANLKVLDLSKTKVTDTGLKKLQPLTKLNWLLLQETEITDAGLENLASMKSLGRLSLNKTKVTAKGIAKLKESLPLLSQVDQ